MISCHIFCIGVSVGGVTGIMSQVISAFGPVTAVRTVRPFGAGLALRHSRRTYISVPIENHVDCVWPGKFLRFHGQLRLSSSTFYGAGRLVTATFEQDIGHFNSCPNPYPSDQSTPLHQGNKTVRGISKILKTDRVIYFWALQFCQGWEKHSIYGNNRSIWHLGARSA